MKILSLSLISLVLLACSHKENINTSSQQNPHTSRDLASGSLRSVDPSPYAGVYINRTMVPFSRDNDSAKNCKAYGGTGGGKTTCMLPVIEKLNVQASSNRQYKISASTWGKDLDTCDFIGEGEFFAENQLRAEQKTPYGICTLDIYFVDDRASVAASANCYDALCGANAGLAFTARRKK